MPTHTKKYPSVEHVRECLRYEDGRLYWLARPREHFATERAWSARNSRFSGKEAGYSHNVAAIHEKEHFVHTISINGNMILRYHIVWAMHHGEWPSGIDHENRNSLDDRIENLRLADTHQNSGNKRKYSTNKSGYKGVSWHKGTSRWNACIIVWYRKIHLGLFDDPAKAHAAYVDAAKKYFGQFAHDGT